MWYGVTARLENLSPAHLETRIFPLIITLGTRAVSICMHGAVPSSPTLCAVRADVCDLCRGYGDVDYQGPGTQTAAATKKLPETRDSAGHAPRGVNTEPSCGICPGSELPGAPGP